MRTQRITAIVLFLFVAAFLIGCPAPGTQLKSVSEMTPKERATWFLSVYNKQFKDTITMAKRTDLTEEQKEIVRAKKKVLAEVKPYLSIYTAAIDDGKLPAKETEDKIIELLNDLMTKF